MTVRPNFLSLLEAHEADIMGAAALVMITLTFLSFILV